MKRRHISIALAATALLCPALARADEPLMDPDQPVTCARDRAGDEWRIQCDSTTKRCLYAPNMELDSTGRRVKPLERARRCAFGDDTFDRAALEKKGYTVVPGRPDAPHGWMRDDRGRVFQVNFDLTRRLYLGGGWAPQARIDEPVDRARSSIDFGLFIYEHTSDDVRTRHRLRLVEGDVHLAPFSADVVLAHYDLSHRFLDPLLRITTFVGEPTRHDLTLDVGVWSEAGHVEVHHAPVTDGGDSTLWKFGVGQVTLDLWQSAQLDSYARLRTGMGLERLYTETMGDRSALTGASAFEVGWIIDDRGFHNLRLELQHEVPRYFEAHPKTGRFGNRMRGRLEYEAIALAINDQPISIVVGAQTERRDDLPAATERGWAFVADIGARFSLWAPPRPQ
jgi:hypothetical protein